MEDDEFGSDDSFFDDPKITKKSNKTQSQKPPAEKKSLEELFGFQEEKKTPVVEPHRPGSSAKSSLSNKVRFDFHEPPVSVSAEISSKSKSLDWLGGSDETDTGFASKVASKIDIDDNLSSTNTKTESRKPTVDFFDDILPPGPKSKKISETERATSFQDIFKDSTASKSSNEKLNTIFEPPQGPRRGRRSSNTGIADVLGLFGASSEPERNVKASIEISKENNVRTSSKDAAKTAVEAQRAESPMKTLLNEEKPQETVKKNPEDSNFQSNISNLQAQESFLLVSLQLKKYEENLAEIKNSQQDILKKQEDQFGIFLNKYLEKQKGIEQEILGQQERINEHIRMMALNGFHQASKSKIRTFEDEEIEETEGLNTIVHCLKQRHQEEFFLMEESYKKQISLLEKSSENLELRLNQEIEYINKTYEEKVLKFKDQNKEEINYWIEKVEKLNKTHIEDLEYLKENHNRMLKETKDEFLMQLERIKGQRNSENDLFINSDALSQKLHSNIEKLENNEIFLDKLQEKVVKDYGILSIARENSLQTKEKEVLQMRAALEKCRENAENDRSQLLALIRSLELKISEQNRNSQEQSWALQQAAATLAARAASFDRETEFNRASIERERQQLRSLKETVLAEQERSALELTEQKIQFAAEKSRLEVSAKLINNYEVEKIKAEAETAIQVAKELTEKMNIERNFIQKQKVELEDVRKNLIEKERVVLEKEETLEEMKRMMEHRGNEDKRMFQETKYLENRYKEKLFELQIQAASLNSREKKLAEEKLSLSKERLSLYSSKSQANNNHKKCMLCQAEEDNKVVIKHPMDLDSVRFRMEIFDDERNSEVSNNA